MAQPAGLEKIQELSSGGICKGRSKGKGKQTRQTSQKCVQAEELNKLTLLAVNSQAHAGTGSSNSAVGTVGGGKPEALVLVVQGEVEAWEAGEQPGAAGKPSSTLHTGFAWP